jgi:hypothetical protein
VHNWSRSESRDGVSEELASSGFVIGAHDSSLVRVDGFARSVMGHFDPPVVEGRKTVPTAVTYVRRPGGEPGSTISVRVVDVKVEHRLPRRPQDV